MCVAMKFLRAEAVLSPSGEPTVLRYKVWLDTARTENRSGNVVPDERWVREWSFPGQPPDGWTGGEINGTSYTDWSDWCTAQVKLLAQHEHAKLTADPQALAVQGAEF